MPSCSRYAEDGKQKHLRTASLDVTNIFVDKRCVISTGSVFPYVVSI